MQTCVPVKDLKDTASFARRVEQASGPITVTKNGYEVFYALRPDYYEALQQEAAKAQLLSRIMLAEQEIDSGDYMDVFEFLDKPGA